MATRKKETTKESVRVSALTLTPSTETILKRLTQDAGDVIGRSVSGSAVLRALLHYAGQQSQTWTYDMLFPLIEQELSSGIAWGKNKSS